MTEPVPAGAQLSRSRRSPATATAIAADVGAGEPRSADTSMVVRKLSRSVIDRMVGRIVRREKDFLMKSRVGLMAVALLVAALVPVRSQPQSAHLSGRHLLPHHRRRVRRRGAARARPAGGRRELRRAGAEGVGRSVSGQRRSGWPGADCRPSRRTPHRAGGAARRRAERRRAGADRLCDPEDRFRRKRPAPAAVATAPAASGIMNALSAAGGVKYVFDISGLHRDRSEPAPGPVARTRTRTCPRSVRCASSCWRPRRGWSRRRWRRRAGAPRRSIWR